MFKTNSKISESYNFNLTIDNVNYKKDFIFFEKNNFVLFTRKKKRKPKQSCFKRIIFKIKKN